MKDRVDIPQCDKVSFMSLHSSKCGGSVTGVLADEADQRGRSAERSSGCL